MTKNSDVIIIGGGLAGLASAIHLSKKGLHVIIIEKSEYPKHKVCGEYISNEILPYLQWLDVDIGGLNPTRINRFEFSTVTGKTVTANLPLGGFGISRYILDNSLYATAVANGCTFVKAAATYIHYHDDIFTVKTKDETFTSPIVIGAYGKRANIDTVLSRNFIKRKSPWLAVKAHYSGNFPDDLVALHNFHGGYCGVSKVEDDKINICYLADYATFKKYRNIEDYQKQVLCKNTQLKNIFENTTMVFDKPLTISQISFDKKSPVAHHVLMAGDTAGLIHPLCGNGMAMAIHSAKIASELVLDYKSGKIASRKLLENEYSRQWNIHFSKRLLMGRVMSSLLKNKTLTKQMLNAAISFPEILPGIIRQTHGTPIIIDY